MDTEERLDDLYESLGEFKPGDKAPWPVAAIFNALLQEVKKEHPDDPVVSVIEPAERGAGLGGPSNFATTNCGSLRTAVAQRRHVV